MNGLLRSAFLLAVLPAAVCAQADWTMLAPAAPPISRDGAAFAASSNELLMFGGDVGGFANPTFTNQLWRFDGQGWTQLQPATSAAPVARQRAAAAWDFLRGRLVVFGGTTVGSAFGDTWEWDGTQWQERVLTPHPSPRRGACMSYEVHTGRVILFGGYDSNFNYLNDTWAFDGNSWTPLAPAHSPGPRDLSRMVYDWRAQRSVLFGGLDSVGLPLTDTWVFDGVDWSQVATPTVPFGQGGYDFAMTYDELRDRTVMFGGTPDGNTRFHSTWEFDGSDWHQRAIAAPPAGRLGAGMAYVRNAGRTFLFGGSSPSPLIDTWAYQTSAPATYARFGTGCASSTGLPELNARSLPWIGTDLEFEVTGVPPGGVALLAAGFMPVQISLAAIGVPGCVVLADPLAIASLPVSPVTGHPGISLPIPMNPVLLGGTLYAQGIVFEPTGGGRLSLTARGDLVFGAL